MIQSFKGKPAKALWEGKNSKLPAEILQRAADKLSILHSTTSFDSLRIPPSNHLEALTGDRKGQHSIRINNHVARKRVDGQLCELGLKDFLKRVPYGR